MFECVRQVFSMIKYRRENKKMRRKSEADAIGRENAQARAVSDMAELYLFMVWQICNNCHRPGARHRLVAYADEVDRELRSLISDYENHLCPQN